MRRTNATTILSCSGILFLQASIGSWSGVSVAAFSQSKPLTSILKNDAESSAFEFEYTHLEVNGMLWQVPGAELSIVVDPIASELNFGIPWAYRAKKKLGEEETLDKIVQAKPSHCLLSQGLDDHTHLATLTKLVDRLPTLEFIVAPSARDKIASIVDKSRIQVLKPNQSISFKEGVTLQATEGALVGPPWQARENGWLLKVNGKSIYMEPHADVTDLTLERFQALGLQADIVISPVKEQSLPAQVPKPGQFTLVYGAKRALEIARALKAKVVIPLANGELETEGPLAGLVSSTGGPEDFSRLVEKDNKIRFRASPIRMELPTPGVSLKVRL
jgi:L-ascorbate metabolism protein UlaG (beta-lactamase superfamily)